MRRTSSHDLFMTEVPREADNVRGADGADGANIAMREKRENNL